MKNNQRNHIGTSPYLTQVKAVLFTVISATSYYQFLGSTPFEITLGIYGHQLKYMHAYVELSWHVCRVHNEEVRGVSIP